MITVELYSELTSVEEVGTDSFRVVEESIKLVHSGLNMSQKFEEKRKDGDVLIKYGYHRGNKIEIPVGWKLLPEGIEVPAVHREFHSLWNSYMEDWTGQWASPRRCRSTMTPIYATIWGSVRAIAVPLDCDIAELRDYTKELHDYQNHLMELWI